MKKWPGMCVNIQSCKHKSLHLQGCGFFIGTEYSFIEATPDGIGVHEIPPIRSRCCETPAQQLDFVLVKEQCSHRRPLSPTERSAAENIGGKYGSQNSERQHGGQVSRNS